MRVSVPARRGLLAAILAVAALALAGCDKCGNRVGVNVPGVSRSCGDAPSPR